MEICYHYVENFKIELFLEFRSSMQQCAGSVAKKPNKTITFPMGWDEWFSDTHK